MLKADGQKNVLEGVPICFGMGAVQQIPFLKPLQISAYKLMW